MLKKLLKYDLIFIYKVLGILYAISIFFAICTRVFGYFDSIPFMNFMAYFSGGVVIGMVFSILINNLIRFWVRFVINFYGDESYLTHTLPVSKRSLFLSKFLASLITLVTSMLVIFISTLLAYNYVDLLKQLMGMIKELLHYSPVALLAAILAIFLLEAVYIFQVGVTGIILGHKMSSGKIGFSVLFAFVCYIICNIMVLIIVVGIGLLNPELRSVLFSSTPTLPTASILNGIFIGATLEYLILNIILYVLNNRWFCKGVNVE